MGSPEKPVDVEMGDMSESAQLNPEKTSEEQTAKSTRFTGLTKEELLEISGQPGWVRARWLLFILFWLVWVGMLVGAIVIVIQAPRCKPDPELAWYQTEVTYVVNEKTFGDVELHLDYVKSLSAKSVIVKGMSADDEFKTMMETIAGDKQTQDFKIIAEVPAGTAEASTAEWMDAGAHGVMVTGFEAFSRAEAIAIVDKLWEKVNETDDARALYLTSTDNDEVSKTLFEHNNMTTVLLSQPFDDCVGQANAGQCFRDAFAPYRSDEFKNVVGYMLSEEFDQEAYQGGLNLLMLSLPGVSIIRSGDEFGGNPNQTAFEWIDSKGDQVPERSVDSADLSNYKKLSPKKAPGIEQEKSLVFDSREDDKESGIPQWRYIAGGEAAPLAFCRQWDTKPKMLVVSNMSPDTTTVDVTGCLTKDDENVSAAKASDASFDTSKLGKDNEGTYNLGAVEVPSGETIIFKG